MQLPYSATKHGNKHFRIRLWYSRRVMCMNSIHTRFLEVKSVYGESTHRLVDGWKPTLSNVLTYSFSYGGVPNVYWTRKRTTQPTWEVSLKTKHDKTCPYGSYNQCPLWISLVHLSKHNQAHSPNKMWWCECSSAKRTSWNVVRVKVNHLRSSPQEGAIF